MRYEPKKDRSQPNDLKLLAKTYRGLEEVLAKELKQLGARDVTVLTRAVSFTGDLGFLYKANLGLRTALRILHPIASFRADEPDEFYDKAMKIKWTDHLRLDQTFSISATVNSSRFTHSNFAALKLKDAIADSFRNEFGQRPSVDREIPDIYFDLHINRNEIIISLDSSGEPLHKRGYRDSSHRAPISEVLAAGMILLSKWDMRMPLFDPMCGSGTIPIEAALMACNIPPGIFRQRWTFANWPNYDDKLFDTIREGLLKRTNDTDVVIFASDIAKSSMDLTREAVERAGLEDIIRMRKVAFHDRDAPAPKGMMIMNPPYGERMDLADTERMYKKIGDTWKQKYPGWKAGIISSNRKALVEIRLRPYEKHRLFNGPLDCSFNLYEFYEGRKVEE